MVHLNAKWYTQPVFTWLETGGHTRTAARLYSARPERSVWHAVRYRRRSPAPAGVSRCSHSPGAPPGWGPCSSLRRRRSASCQTPRTAVDLSGTVYETAPAQAKNVGEKLSHSPPPNVVLYRLKIIHFRIFSRDYIRVQWEHGAGASFSCVI